MYEPPDISKIAHDEEKLIYERNTLTGICKARHLKINGLDKKTAYGIMKELNIALTKLHHNSINKLTQSL